MSELLRHFVLPQWEGCSRRRTRKESSSPTNTQGGDTKEALANGPLEMEEGISQSMDRLIGERKSGHFSLAPLHLSIRLSIRHSSICHYGSAENICSYRVITVSPPRAPPPLAAVLPL